MGGPEPKVLFGKAFTECQRMLGPIARKTLILVALVVGLPACDVVTGMVDGLKYAQAVESELEQATGVRPGVGFNWHNGRLASVTVTFPQLYDGKPLREIADLTRAAVGKEFKQTPKSIVLAFSLSGTPSTSAETERPHRTN